MIIDIIEIAALLAGILFVCLGFTNAVENIGVRLKLGEQVVGSLLAAIGTALPETLLPLIAIFLASNAANTAETVNAKHDIAIGSIIGAPFLLGTLAMFLLGLSVLVHYKSRNKDMKLNINPVHVARDLKYFIYSMIIAIIAAIFHHEEFRWIYTVILVGIYIIYFYRTLTYANKKDPTEVKSPAETDAGEEEHVDKLYLAHISVAGYSLPNNLTMMIIQTALSLLGIVLLAHEFIYAIEHFANLLGASPLILSLIISPIATELPEKVNSWIWAGQGKDSLAMGNISGAMVFQAAIPCAVGVSLTPWKLDSLTLFCAILALLSACIILFSLKIYKKLHAGTLTSVGVLYLLYLVAIILF